MHHINLEDFDPKVLRVGMEVNIVVGPADPEIVNLMFQPDGEEIFLQAPVDITWPQLLAALGCWPSVTQARKNWGQDGRRKNDIDCGFNEVTVGKARKISIHLYKPFYNEVAANG